MSLEDRISALSARADVLTVRVAKAAAAGPKRPRIPGDGDGDGIANEGKKPGASLPKGALGRAKMNSAKQPMFNGKTLGFTGKEGTNRATGMKVREHEVLDSEGRKTGERYWIGPKNVVFPD